MKILFVHDNSIGIHYLKTVLSCIDPKEAEITTIKLSEYPVFDDKSYDKLIYNTFPDENHKHKFRKDLIAVTDKKFLNFQGDKILFDSHDDGGKDAFMRLIDPYNFSLIKVAPKKIFRAYPRVMSVPFAVNAKFMDATQPKTIPIIFCSRLDGYPHNIRQQVYDQLKSFNPFTERLDFYSYTEKLKQAQISVVAPGWGDVCLAHYEALASGALLFAHRNIEDYQMFTVEKLIEGKHYVAYDLGNMKEKLHDLLATPNKVAGIARAGNKIFQKAYNMGKLKKKIMGFIETTESKDND